MALYAQLLDAFKAKYICDCRYSGFPEGAYIPDEKGMYDYRLLCAVGQSSYGYPPEAVMAEMTHHEFRGPDWYFFDGYRGDREGPGSWWFETLSEKKEEFRKFCKKHPVPNSTKEEVN